MRPLTITRTSRSMNYTCIDQLYRFMSYESNFFFCVMNCLQYDAMWSKFRLKYSLGNQQHRRSVRARQVAVKIHQRVLANKRRRTITMIESRTRLLPAPHHFVSHSYQITIKILATLEQGLDWDVITIVCLRQAQDDGSFPRQRRR